MENEKREPQWHLGAIDDIGEALSNDKQSTKSFYCTIGTEVYEGDSLQNMYRCHIVDDFYPIDITEQGWSEREVVWYENYRGFKRNEIECYTALFISENHLRLVHWKDAI